MWIIPHLFNLTLIIQYYIDYLQHKGNAMIFVFTLFFTFVIFFLPLFLSIILFFGSLHVRNLVIKKCKTLPLSIHLTILFIPTVFGIINAKNELATLPAYNGISPDLVERAFAFAPSLISPAIGALFVIGIHLMILAFVQLMRMVDIYFPDKK